MRGRTSEQREARVARQIEALLAQEEALDQRRAELREREDRVARRERDLDQRAKERELAWAKRTGELDERERKIAAAEQVLATREQALEQTARKKARSLAQEAVSLAERGKEVAWREKAVQEVLPGQPPAAAAAPGEDTEEIAPAPVVPPDGWNLNRIERLVEMHADEYPARADEWRYYLLYLREFADIGGALPRSFDWLVWDAFGDLLAKVPAGAAGVSPPAEPAPAAT